MIYLWLLKVDLIVVAHKPLKGRKELKCLCIEMFVVRTI